VGDDGKIGQEELKPILIADIANIEVQSSVDVLAIIANAGMTEEVALRTGDTKARRNVDLVDQSQTSIRITLWGEMCSNPKIFEGNIIGLKCAVVREYNDNKTLSYYSKTSLLEPDQNTQVYQELVKF